MNALPLFPLLDSRLLGITFLLDIRDSLNYRGVWIAAIKLPQVHLAMIEGDIEGFIGLNDFSLHTKLHKLN